VVQEPMGLTSAEIDPRAHGSVWRELLNKLSWTIGSVYGVSYSRTDSIPREQALVLARLLLENQGYPRAMKRK